MRLPATSDRALDLATLVPLLLEWALQNGRDYAWRRGSPYELAVAEILLQKTRGEDAERVWREVVARFPAPEDLASASEDSLFPVVSRLGLGSQRAGRLKAMAIALSLGGPEGDRLPGLGSYGCGIVQMTLGLHPKDPPVDGNIARVVVRWCGLLFDGGEARKKAEVAATVRHLYETVVPNSEELTVVYALVDLGATVCLPRKPSCNCCPLAPGCAFNCVVVSSSAART